MRLVWLPLIFVIACSKSHTEDGGPSPAPPVTPPEKVAPVKNKPVDCPEGTPYAQCRSFAMKLTGRNGRPPNAADLKFVAEVVGGLVSRMKVKAYYLFERFPDGGFEACFDPVADGGYEAAVNEFTTFSVGNETFWDVHPALSCTDGG